jgi:hypothetical protein
MGSPHMRQNRYNAPYVGGSVVVWLVVAAVAGLGLLGVFEPGSLTVLVSTEL